MKGKKLLSTLLAISVSVSSFAAATITANAETTAKKTMNMGYGVISADAENAKDRDIIYYGNEKKFRVLSTNGNTTNTADFQETADATFNDDAQQTVAKENALFVISENDFSTRAFDMFMNQMWQTSEAKKWCNEIKNYASSGFYTAAGITTAEKAAILTTSKSDAAYDSFKATSISDKVFYISAKEAHTYFNSNDDRKFTPDGSVSEWWLRSPVILYDDYVGIVNEFGYLFDCLANIDYNVASRPAFNLNLSSVLFTSKADGVSDAVEAYSGNEWKLTLKDSNRSVTIGNIARNGNKVTVNYSGATTGTNAKVSYIVTDATGMDIISYGNADTTGSGSIDVTISDDTNKIFVFSEQDNGAYKTNYASELNEVAIPADGFAVRANVNDSNMGSVTSSKARAKVGEDVTLTATANEGYKLVGFASNDIDELWVSGNKCMFTMPENDVTVTATFEAVSVAEHTITVSPNFSGMGSVSVDKSTAKIGEVVTLTANPNPGNTLAGFICADVEINGNQFVMIDKDISVVAMFKANASFLDNTATPIQAQINDDNTAILRFMWGLNKTDGAYISNIGAYIIPAELFDNKAAAKPAVVLIPNPAIASGNTFSADYINIPEAEFDTEFLAIPFINGTFFADAKLYGNVDTYAVNKAQAE